MLLDQNKYSVSKGLSHGGKVDLQKQVALNAHPQMPGLGYSYGELQDPEEVRKQQQREQFTSSYEEMLSNPNKKVMVLGLHPEFNTADTRAIQAPMEDPIIKLSDQDVQDYQEAQNKRIDAYTLKMAQFIHLMDNQTASRFDDTQMDILSQISAFIQENSRFDQIKALKEDLQKVMQKMIQQHENTVHGSGLLQNTNSTPAPE